ncbi:MAG: tetratricopeptide repeat protein [Alphaproteobacteria bacterium]|nr:tetratricopeptide repeat protein [Alphaproteobacteria bacterium]
MGSKGGRRPKGEKPIAPTRHDVDPWRTAALSNAIECHRSGRIGEAESGYRAILDRFSDDVDALNLLGVVLRQRGRAAEAVDLIARAADIAPGLAEVQNNLGNVLLDVGRLDDAATAYRRALAIQPEMAETHVNLGNTMIRLRRLDEAAECFAEALRRRPGLADAAAGLGRALLDLGRPDEAIAPLEEATRLRPEDGESWFALGEANRMLGRRRPAVDAFRAAVRLDPRLGLRQIREAVGRWFGFGAKRPRPKPEAAPSAPDDADAHNEKGRELFRAGRHSEAMACFLEATVRRPDHAEALSNLGVALRTLGQPQQAIGPLRRAAELLPDRAEAHLNLGVALAELGRHDEAVATYRRALALREDYSDALNNIAVVLQQTGDLDGARQALERARELAPRLPEAANNLALLCRRQGDWHRAVALLEETLRLKPDYVEALFNLGNLLREEQRVEDALARLDDAVRRAPDNALAHWNRSHTLLAAGRLREGWEEYEWRWRWNEFPGPWRPHPQPLWDGSAPEGRTILIHGEQGPGDLILYGSMLPDLLTRGAKVVFEVEERMVPLFQRSMPEMRVVPMLPEPVPETRDPAIACRYPLASLARHFRADFADFPARSSYLRADPELAARLRARYLGLGGTMVVGISWRSKNLEIGAEKSTRLVDWAPILTVPGVRFVNLQYGDCRDEIAEAKRELGVDVFADPEIDPLRDMDSFAAQVAAMDLVISVSNSTVHVAGALGVPVWVMLPRGRGLLHFWYFDREDSPWYPSARLFRQAARGDWKPVVERVAGSLAKGER